MKELRKLINKEVRKALAETYAKPHDMEKIEDFIMSAPEFESTSPTKLKRAVGEMYDEWKSVASNYKDIEEYFEEIEQTGGLEGFLPENKNTMNRTKLIVKRLKEDTAYQEFFKKAMEKFKISSPADLKDPARKKEFFDYVDKNYKAKDEMSEGTQLMSNPEVKSKVEMVISTLKDIDVDGETMQYILKEVGMEEQMLHQLTPGGIR